jgi:2-oxoglutarate dehydrogenase E2 component (dihydrolipoamide succinyltransferase)
MNTPDLELRVPAVGESVSEVEVGAWLKQPGDTVQQDEPVVVLETDKATVELPSPIAGTLLAIAQPKGARVSVGEVLGRIGTLPPAAGAAQPIPPASSAVQSKVTDPAAPLHPSSPPTPPQSTQPPPVPPPNAPLPAEPGPPATPIQPTGTSGGTLKDDAPMTTATARSEEVVPMTLLRRKIAEKLVQAQQHAALLTTFNEIDMSTVRAVRTEHQERFQERYGVKLGFMSFFVKATVEALKDVPQLNAEIRDRAIVFRNYYDIGIAIGAGRGLVVPILRNAESLGFADIEKAIADFGQRAKENRIAPEDLAGGTFTITNGGVYGSLLSTPIVNPPQSGVLGLHAIQDRPVARDGQVVIRPMMYVALTYDHRLVDGREAVTFLRRIKELIEQPVRLLIEI